MVSALGGDLVNLRPDDEQKNACFQTESRRGEFFPSPFSLNASTIPTLSLPATSPSKTISPFAF